MSPMKSWQSYLDHHLDILGQDSTRESGSKIDSIAERIVERLVKGGKIVVAGNGGSASDANHIVGELMASFAHTRPGIRALSLVSNSSMLTAWTNDYEFETVFSRQIESLCEANDCVILISTSGASKNIVNAAISARAAGSFIVALTGQSPNALSALADETLSVDSTFTPTVQEAHEVYYHYLCLTLEKQYIAKMEYPLVPRY